VSVVTFFCILNITKFPADNDVRKLYFRTQEYLTQCCDRSEL